MSKWRIWVFVFLTGLFCAREISSARILKADLQAIETSDCDGDADAEKDGIADESDFFIFSDLIDNLNALSLKSASGFLYSEPNIKPHFNEIQLPPPEIA